jgi:hypothetical protein
MSITRTVNLHDGDEITTYQNDVDWVQVREVRNYELKNSDWRAVKDRTMSQAWKDYRQALRDLPQDYELANDAVDNWPEAPE